MAGAGATGPRAGAVARAGRLDVVVVEVAPELSRARAAALIRDGRVVVDGVTVTRPAHAVRVGQVVSVEVPPPVALAAAPQDLPVRFVHRDAHLVVVDKAPGMVVHPGAGHADGTLVNALLHHVGELSGIGGALRPGIVHRLDRGTSGLMVVACHDVAHRALAAQFAAHTARRRYVAVCAGVPEQRQGTLRSHLGRHPTDRLRFASVEPPAGKPAITHWRLLGAGRGVSLVECALETGRTHQIRVHLAEAGLPLLGDGLYGGRRAAPPWRADLPVDRPLLHAWRLDLRHPATGAMCRFLAPVHPDLLAVVDAAGIAWPAHLPR